MITKKYFDSRQCLIAVVIFFGVSATPCQAAEDESANVVEVVDDSSSEESENVLADSEEDIKVEVQSTTPQTVNNENFAAQSDINSNSFGLTVEGVGNRIAIPTGKTIQSLGKGILISYGRDHNLDVAGKIATTGNAIEFNFGSNSLGVGEYRGSYIRYLRSVDTEGNIISVTNLPIEMANGEFNYAADELNGALVSNFNLSGKISGSRAIYIGQSAFVKNININRGAEITGDIVSEWKHFSDGEAISIQYNGQTFSASTYIPDLVTDLNFNTDLTYDGKISGADNIKMHINNGTLNFSGTADVVSVDVMSGAKLYGGTFIVNAQGQIAEGFSDSTAGKFINHGTIAAGSPNTNLVINGDLISDGIL